MYGRSVARFSDSRSLIFLVKSAISEKLLTVPPPTSTTSSISEPTTFVSQLLTLSMNEEMTLDREIPHDSWAPIFFTGFDKRP